MYTFRLQSQYTLNALTHPSSKAAGGPGLQAKREMGLAVPGTAEFEAAWPDRCAGRLGMR